MKCTEQALDSKGTIPLSLCIIGLNLWRNWRSKLSRSLFSNKVARAFMDIVA
jgi:hypothetical protein